MIAVESRCSGCNRGEPHGKRFRGRIYHSVYGADGKALDGVIKLCRNFDDEQRHIAEPLGLLPFFLATRALPQRSLALDDMGRRPSRRHLYARQ